MPHLALLLLVLSLLTTPAANGILPFAAALLSSNHSWEIDTSGPPPPPADSPDSGWEMDPDG